jgi:hypothetical protein
VAPHITAERAWVLGEWHRFDVWMQWKDRGSPKPRPVALWRRVPDWAWVVRRELLKARPKSPPAPPAPAVPPAPPLPPSAAQYQHGIYLGQNAEYVRLAPAKYKAIFTADPAYDSQATASLGAALRAEGREVQVWFVPTEVSLARAQEVARRVGASLIIGQAESAEQFDASWNCGLRGVIGNLAALREDQLAKVRSGEMAFVHEHYWNCQPGLQLDDKNLPVVSHCIAVYSDADCQRRSVAEYIAAGRFHPGDSCYGPGMVADDYRALP